MRGAALWLGLWILACSGLDTTELPAVGSDHAVPADDEPVAEAQPVPPTPIPTAGMLPLAVGHRWTYEVRKRTGGGARVIGFSTQKATDVKLADWTFSIDAVETFPDGERYRAKLVRTPVDDDLPATTDMLLEVRDGVVWMNAGNGERPAIEAVIPPGAVSSERVRCVAHMLGGAVGTCAPVTGGPLGAKPGLESGVVGSDTRENADVAQVLVGVVTMGIFIPGNKSSVEKAYLEEFFPAEGTAQDFAAGGHPLIAAVNAAHDKPEVLSKRVAELGGGAEAAAAAVASLDSRRAGTAALGLLPALSAEDRYPVARTAIQHADDPLRTLARLRPLLDPQIAQDQAVGLLALFPTELEKAAAVVSGESALFIAVTAGTDGVFDSDVTAALDRELPNHPTTVDDVGLVLGLFSFDDAKLDAANTLIATLSPADRPQALERALAAITFDDAKLGLFEAHKELIATLSVDQRERMADTISFKKDEARVALGL